VSRFLFVVPPLAGHVNPTVGLGQELAGRGHEVAWAGSELVLRPFLGEAATVFPTGSRVLRDQGEGGLSAVRTLWREFIVPYAKFTKKALNEAAATYQPDVIIGDEHTPAGAFTAHRHGIRWATMATSSMEINRPYRSLPLVEAWMTDHLRALWKAAGLPEDEYLDPRFSPFLVLAQTSRALTGPAGFPEHFALVGPILAARPAQQPFPWERLDPGRPCVLVTMGTLAADVAEGFYRRAVDALRPLGDRLQAIVVAPPEAMPADLPDHIIAAARVPMLDLLGRGAVQAVVCHAGMNTVCETLAHRLPLVLAPIRHDQPVTAGQVVAAGAGVRVRFSRVSAPVLRRAIESLLDDPSYRAAAGRISDRFAEDGGARTAADRLEALAGAR
jgi:MGT family glycosyltransferase